MAMRSRHECCLCRAEREVLSRRTRDRGWRALATLDGARVQAPHTTDVAALLGHSRIVARLSDRACRSTLTTTVRSVAEWPSRSGRPGLMRNLALFLTTVCGVLWPHAEVAAKPLSGDRSEGSCSEVSAEVLRWTPSEGSLANYLADAFGRNDDMFVALGYDAKGFWSAEADIGSDACEGQCTTMRLVRTSFDGKERRSFLVGRSAHDEPGTPAERRKKLKARIFSVVRSDLDLAALEQDYTFQLPKHDAEGKIEKFTGWFAQVKRRDARLRFALVNESQMCWCFPSWSGYALADRKPKARK
jgi:hypothetical protein